MRKKDDNKPQKKLNIPVFIAFILLWATCVTTFMTSGLFARYTTKGSSFDSARVIKFQQLTVTETGDFTTTETGINQFLLVPGVNIKKDYQVTFNGSESATYVFIVVETPGWSLSDDSGYNFHTTSGKLTWSVEKTTWTFLPTESSSNEFVYYHTLDPNKSLDVGFINQDTIYVSSDLTRTEISQFNTTSLQIKLTAYVVQANGFQSVEDAWKSLSEKHHNS